MSVPSIDDVAMEYNNAPGRLGNLSGSGQTYREIRLSEWPDAIHYEFVPRADRYQIEFHWQIEDRPMLKHTISTLARNAIIAFPQCEVTKTSALVKTHRLCLKLPPQCSALDIALAMHHFILWSRPAIAPFARCAHT
jgi:hypothetical protein